MSDLKNLKMTISVDVAGILLNGILIRSGSRILPGPESNVEHFDKEGTLYPFVFDSVIDRVDGNATVLNEGDRTIQEFGIKFNVEKATLKKNSIRHELLKVATTTTQTEESVWNPIRISDKDSKLHGGKVGLGEPTLRKHEEKSEKVTVMPISNTSSTITIKFANGINLLQWAREWGCNIDEIYQPFWYEKEEEPKFEPTIEKKDPKRRIEDVIDLNDETPQPKKKKTPIYRDWTISDVSKWLKRTDPEWEECGYDKLFESSKIDGRCLEDMTHDLLKEIGVKIVGDRIKILRAIGEIGQ